MPDLTPLVFLLLLVALIEIGLIIFSIYDLTRSERKVRGNSKVLWVIVILVFNLLGPLLYLTVGRDQSSSTTRSGSSS